MKNLSHARWLLMLFVFMALTCSKNKTWAQADSSWIFTPGGYLDTVLDRFGNKYPLGEIAINDKVRGAYRGGYAGLHISTCSSGYFQIYMEDGCGFEGSYAAATARLNVICQVLHDLSEFIHSPLTATGQKVNIWLRPMGSIAGGPFAAVATSFHSVPYSTTASGISDNAVWVTINSGIDAYTNVASPLLTAGGLSVSSGTTFFHGMMAFDTALNWNTNLSMAPSGTQRDLYSVALHEICHALGFATLIDYNGLSMFGTGYKYYSRYDTHLKTHSGTSLLTHTTSCGVYSWQFNSGLSASAILSPGGTGVCPLGYDTTSTFIDSTKCDTAVKYVDGIIADQPVFTSPCFLRASSLSHFEDKCYVPGTFSPSPPASNDLYFVMSNRNLAGVMKRYLKPEERQVLCDIGYNVDTVYGNTAMHTHYSYGGSICPGIQVVGINDGLDTTGLYTFFTSPGSSVGMDSLLKNDYNADSFKCLEVVIGSGTVSTTTGGMGTVVNFTPGAGAFGVQLLRYIPVDSAGVEGNITYVYVFVGDSACHPTACDLVSNGEFEHTSVSAAYSSMGSQEHCWNYYTGTADVFSRDAATPTNWRFPLTYLFSTPTDVHFPGTSISSPNDHFIGFQSIWDNVYHIANVESVQTILSSGLVHGNKYVVSCWAKLGDKVGTAYLLTTLPGHIELAIHSSSVPLAPTTLATGFTPAFTHLWDFEVSHPDTNWHYFTDTVIYTGPTPGNTLVVAPAPWFNATAGYPNWYEEYFIIDGVSIQPFPSVCTFTPPDTICAYHPTFNLYGTVSCPGGTFVWQKDSSGTVVTTHDTIFDPAAAYPTAIGEDSLSFVTVCYMYTNGIGCHETACKEIVIYPYDHAITGPSSVCMGSTITLTGIVSGGTWVSVDTSIATIDSATGVVTPVDTGVVEIAYVLPDGCLPITQITVNPLPAPITGTYTVCAGNVGGLTCTTAGGTWSSSNAAVASIDIDGVYFGASAGTATISYILPSGCASTVVVTVYTTPTAITGTKTVCTGATTALASTPAGGTWSSSNPSAGTISTGGIVTGIAAGTTIVSYTLGTGCSTSAIVTVYTTPAAITGTLTVCASANTTLSDATPGGTWGSSDPTIATVISGVVTGVNPGTATITYTVTGGCTANAIVTVLTMPAITGTHSVCTGASITLTGTPSGGTWSSSASGIASVSGGIVTGVSGGTATISYNLGGCIATHTITANPSPSSISGTLTVCEGLTTSLSNTLGGGTWTSSTPAAGTVNTSGVVTGVHSGTTTISYTVTGGCTVTAIVTVLTMPAITGTDSVCTGLTISLTGSPSGGIWSSSASGIASVSSGVVTGVAVGTATISYNLSGCITTHAVSVNLSPASIGGTLSVCAGFTTSLTNSTAGGTWASSAPAIASVGTSGIVTGNTAGTATITYSLAHGCYATVTVTVNPIPTIGTIFTVCTGLTRTLTGSPSGGTWISGTTAVATIGSSTGIVTGVLAGTTIITYTSPAGCTTTQAVTVYTTPVAITGTFSQCAGNTTTLSDATSGGTWSSSTPAVGTINSSTGVFTAISAGTTTVTYTVTGGCTATAIMTVNPLPAPITAASTTMCAGDTMTAHDATAGGTWSSSNTSVGTINSATGLITAISSGTTRITYMLPTGCFVTVVGTVNPLPSAISGADSFCIGTTETYNDLTGGGTWSSSSPAVGTINASTGVLTGISGGTTTITYTVTSTGCHVTKVVRVRPLPVVAPIVCPDTICLLTSSLVSDPTPGGQWNISGEATLVYGTGGSVSVEAGITPGTAILSYTVFNDCGFTRVTKTIVISGPPVVAPITGVLGVCSDYTTTLHDAIPGGTWSSSNPSIASIGSLDGVVTGHTAGSVTITYRITTICGTIYTTVNVLVNMEPYITANFLVACQTLAYWGYGETAFTPVISGSTCVLTCDSSTVRYYAHGVAGSVFTWTVTGGTIVSTYPPNNDSIDVFWTTPGLTGYIAIHDTFHHCIDSARACITVIEKPHAVFSLTSDKFCLDEDVIFTDASYSSLTSPIVYYHWDFGDGTGSAAAGTTHHVYHTPGKYTVKLIVRNQCNCTDSMTFKIEIMEHHGPDIQCPAVVCDSGYATYTTSVSCGTYNWSVSGGTIVSGLGSPTIVVQWDTPDTSGFGTVTLETPGCVECDLPTTIRVPVILKAPSIHGPDIICTNTEVEYSFPLWPATSYHWGVPGTPAAIEGCREDYKVVVKFSSPGTYTLHGWYENRLTLCGGDIDKTITVLPPATIVGASPACAAATYTYSVSIGYPADWTVKDLVTGGITTYGTAPDYTFAYPDAHTYQISASGGFCAEPINVTVLPPPMAIDSVTGPDTVCLNRIYSYHAWSSTPGSIFNWEITGGTITPGSGTDIVNVVWTTTGTKELKVKRVSIAAPHCEGPQTVINVMHEVIAPYITGDYFPCANSLRYYSANYRRGEVYDWLIIPNTAGSVVTGNHSPDNSIIWNNTDTTVYAELIVTIHKCDTVVADTVLVTISGNPPVSASCISSTPVCPGSPLAFVATPGGSHYDWYWGDGYSSSTDTCVATHMFDHNHADTTAYTHVTVHITYSGTDCSVQGTAGVDVALLPSPDIWLSSDPATSVCAPDTVTLISHTATNAGAITAYAWSNGATGATTTVTSGGSYRCIVTAANGCTDTAFVDVDVQDCGEGGGCNMPLTYSVSCGTITVEAPGATGTWTAVRLPLGGALPAGTNPVSATYASAGIYKFVFSGTYGECTREKAIFANVYMVPAIRSQVKCGTGGLDTVFLYDATTKLTGVTITAYSWYTNVAGVLTSMGITTPNTYVLRPPNSTDTFTLKVQCTRPDGTTTEICFASIIVHTPPALTATFTFTTTPTCDKVPVRFTPIVTGTGLSYYWDFGDTSSLKGAGAKREYTWFGPLDFDLHTAKLIVTDGIGCTAEDSAAITVRRNRMDGDLGLDQVLCSPDAPAILTFTPIGTSPAPITYLWSDGQTTNPISVNESGAYWVTVVGPFGCQVTRPTMPTKALNVAIIHTPQVHIYGVQHYCDGETVKLNGFVGDSVLYHWYRNGSLILTGDVPQVSNAGLAPGTYTYKLVIEVDETIGGTLYSCYDTDSVIVHIYPLPAPPIITGPTDIHCSDYTMQLKATSSVSGDFHWSDGPNDSIIRIDHGGPYRVYFTDLHGCVSHADTSLPLAPDTYFPYFPSGCYTICTDMFKLKLFGPPCVKFDGWDWLYGGTSVFGSGGSVMEPYPIPATGDYSWRFDNGLCADTSDEMNLNKMQCDCQGYFKEVHAICDPSDPGSYMVVVTFFTPDAGSYDIGSDIGPLVASSGTVPGGGFYIDTFTFTTFMLDTLADSMTVQMRFLSVHGEQCYFKMRVPLDTCVWAAQRGGGNQGSHHVQHAVENAITSSLLNAYPNPSSGEVAIKYDYGSTGYQSRSLAVYDVMGRLMAQTAPDEKGIWRLETDGWASGMYVIRMEGDNTPLQTKRIVIMH